MQANRVYYQDFNHSVLCCVQSRSIVRVHLQPTFPSCLSSDFSCHMDTLEWETESWGNYLNCTDFYGKKIY
jgi:hypothetical protein